jgi:hypothetical protein
VTNSRSSAASRRMIALVVICGFLSPVMSNL